MLYRKFGRLDWKPSALGFGCMRLPCRGGATMGADIDEPEAVRLIRFGVDSGVNYVDTAYPYHGGASEPLVGRALAGGYREKVKLATKCPVWLVQGPGDFDRILDEQLRRLRTGHIDFYLLHALSAERWELVKRHRLIERAEAAVKAGKIGHIGFSFHDGPEAFVKIVDAYDGWTFCQIQYNYMDTRYQAGTAGLKYAASKGLAVVVMEPLRGGALANPPREVREIFDAAGLKRSPAEWGLRWVWDQPEVSLLLSGMGAMPQLEENLRAASAAGPGDLGPEERAAIDAARRRFEARAAVPCTRCGYCMPCPNGVDIPFNFELYNAAVMYDDLPGARFRYASFLPEGERASACAGCGACEARCPQKIKISGWLAKAAALLGGK